MRTVTANGLAAGALNLLGVYNSAETPTPAELAQGVSLLNDLIDEWATQELTIPQTVREVFSLTNGKQTYTIGSGGDFDTVKPQAIDAWSVLINPATVYSVSSITRSSATATVTTAVAHGYVTGTNVAIAGSTQSDYNGTFIVTVTGAQTFTYTVSGSPTTPATGTITAQNAIGQAYELFGAVLTYSGYISIGIKGQPSTFPTALYYNPNMTNSALGQIFLWQVPNQANSIALYTGRILAQFDENNPTPDIILPPAYARALRYNLAVELAPIYPQQTLTQLILDGARKSFGNIKTQNDNPEVMSTGEAGMLFGSAWGQYSYIDFLTGP